MYLRGRKEKHVYLLLVISIFHDAAIPLTFHGIVVVVVVVVYTTLAVVVFPASY